MHEHHHHHIAAESDGELKAFLQYMLKHNASHADELKSLAEKLKSSGSALAGEKALAALEQYKKGNALLEEALNEYDKDVMK